MGHHLAIVWGRVEDHPGHLQLLAGDPAQLRRGDLDGTLALLAREVDAIEHGIDNAFQRLGLVLGDGGALRRAPAPVELDGDPLGARITPAVPQEKERENLSRGPWSPTRSGRARRRPPAQESRRAYPSTTAVECG